MESRFLYGEGMIEGAFELIIGVIGVIGLISISMVVVLEVTREKSK